VAALPSWLRHSPSAMGSSTRFCCRMSQDVSTGGIHDQGVGAEILAWGRIMLDEESLSSVAQQVMSFELNGKAIPVQRTSAHRLRRVGLRDRPPKMLACSSQSRNNEP
jgi:hypothetical protein